MSASLDEIRSVVAQAVGGAQVGPTAAIGQADVAQLRADLSRVERRLRELPWSPRSVPPAREVALPAPRPDVARERSRALMRAALRVSRTRPRARLSAAHERLLGLTENVFCATGEGGGVDPSCGRTQRWQDRLDAGDFDLSPVEDQATDAETVEAHRRALRDARSRLRGLGIDRAADRRLARAERRLDVALARSEAEATRIEAERESLRVLESSPPAHDPPGGDASEGPERDAYEEEHSRAVSRREREVERLRDRVERLEGRRAARLEDAIAQVRDRYEGDIHDLVTRRLDAIDARPRPTGNAGPHKVRPADLPRLKDVTPYLYDVLGDVTKADAREIARALRRGLERGWQPSSVARLIADRTDVEPSRALTIARTELARARTDRDLDRRRPGQRVVFTLGDEACPICRALEGTVRTVRKAQGVIPVHPNCRCRWEVAPADARVTNSAPVADPAPPVSPDLLRLGRLLSATPQEPDQ